MRADQQPDRDPAHPDRREPEADPGSDREAVARRAPGHLREVSKEQFKEMYFAYGRAADGWGPGYWDSEFEKQPPVPMKYFVEEPRSPSHCRMMIVSDYEHHAHRLFFMTEEAEETHFGR
jgi:hypothetical protein